MGIGMRRREWLLATLIGLVAGASPAAAQWRYLSPESGPSLTKEDLEMQRETVLSLLAMDPPRPGTSRSWSNPRTGARGQVTLRRAFTSRGAPCRDMQYRVTTRGAAKPRELALKLCSTADGSWRVAE